MKISLFSSIKAKKENKIFYNKLKIFLGFKPKNLEFYFIAFRHSSATINTPDNKINNERLEFIGDAVLNLLIADVLYQKKSNYTEGSLSLIRSKIVCRKNLNNIAKKIRLSDFLICKNAKFINSSNIEGNALEALFGAIFYDRGYKYCKKFAEDILLSEIEIKKMSEGKEDFKSQIINFCQKNKIHISFDTFENCEVNEKTHHFICEILLNDNFLTRGKGWSKKEAEQNSAKKALDMDFSQIIEISEL